MLSFLEKKAYQLFVSLSFWDSVCLLILKSLVDVVC